MLKIMEDELKVFRAWLYKYVKKDKKITGKKLASLIGVSGPTLTSYHSGRTDEGVTSFPNISFKKRKLILEATNTPHEEMMKTGRQESQPDPTTIQELVKRQAEMEAEMMEVKAQLPTTPIDTPARPQNDIERRKTQKNQPHHDLVNEFEQPEKAFELNCILRKIEKIQKSKFKKIKKFLLAELEELEEAAPQESEDPNLGNKMG
ncbi:MAG: hypothetical protein DRH26_17195 [Deltaproteobacteria bacterium]|nr:MAG: hypothetical protein DRH26_17195 [Deltaproteobacteria bacterium]